MKFSLRDRKNFLLVNALSKTSRWIYKNSCQEDIVRYGKFTQRANTEGTVESKNQSGSFGDRLAELYVQKSGYLHN